ncbi:MAG TPA: protein kinase [Polyangiaceae bacterium]|nr:protein kinase [Polyangiaceae bacterium]
MTEVDSVPPVAAGEVLAGKYRVERVLGAGGMGVVVRALHLELDQYVAVKFLLPSAIQNPEIAARFMREARAVVRIKSEHVARVIDVGRLETGAPYIVMEFLHGSDLGTVLQHGPLQLEEAVDYVLQTCEAIAEAHAAGIVHRDLKPANLFLTQRADGSPIVKVLDFGISKVAPGYGEPNLTHTSTLLGSPLYMSPEQLRSSRSVDQRTDVWSLGIILFEMLTQRLPFSADTLPQLIASILSDPPEALRARHPAFPPDLEAVIAKALEKDVDKRYRSVGELASALVRFAPRRSRDTTERILRLSGMDNLPSTERGPLGTPLASIPAPPDALGMRTNSGWAGTQSGRKRRTSTLIVVGASALGAGVVLAVALAFRTAGAPSAAHNEPAPSGPSGAPVSAAVPLAPPTVAPSTSPALEQPAPVPAASEAPPASAKSKTPLAPVHPLAAAPSARSSPGKPNSASPSPSATSTSPSRPANPLSIDIK